MKTIILPMLALLATIGMSAHGQGRVQFNNVFSGNAIHVYSDGGVSGGPDVYPGGDYSIQLLWAPGTNYGSRQEFYGAIQGASLPVGFFGATGSPPAHGPSVDGAGLFDGGAVAIGEVGTYTMAARAWYNGGQYPSYDAAVSAHVNTGVSELLIVNATASPTPANFTAFSSFSIGFSEPVSPPKLAIALTNNQALVSWPYNPAYNLQTTTNLGSGWLNIPGPFPVVDGRVVVTNTTSESARYFRLWR